MTTLEKAIKIIVSNEGNYGSVNANDNGALSVGICQWHADRAKKLLQTIYKTITLPSNSNWYIFEATLFSDGSWKSYIPSEAGINIIKYLLCTQQGKEEQDKLIKKDVQSYINAVMKYDITDENTIVLLADICNQGGAGAIKRIINDTFEEYGKHATLENFMETALQDKVFKKFTARRLSVYERLIGHKYISSKGIVHVVKRHETLYSLAHRYGTTVKKIVDDNNIKNPSLIVVGQELRIIK